MKYGLMAVASAFALLATASVSNAAPAGRLGITGTNSSVIKVADADDVVVHHRRHRNSGLAIVIGDGDEHRHHRRWRHHDDDDDNHEHHRRWRHHRDDDDSSGVSIRLGSGHRRHHVE